MREYENNINTAGEVPTLLYKGSIIRESDVIVEFIDKQFPDVNPLMPSDPN